MRQSSFDAGKFLDDRFELISSETLHCQWVPDSEEELRNLLAMTPHHWRARPDAKAGIGALAGQPMNGPLVIPRRGTVAASPLL